MFRIFSFLYFFTFCQGVLKNVKTTTKDILNRGKSCCLENTDNDDNNNNNM